MSKRLKSNRFSKKDLENAFYAGRSIRFGSGHVPTYTYFKEWYRLLRRKENGSK